ncbi:hypothetical protein [Corynebacterium sp. AOP12-C2-36]|uniref:hypothetical protein n=1 Tax=Corynebacterium sp. AOP12-C2-36 TaxID=3457723 RepID=UPI0040333A36
MRAVHTIHGRGGPQQGGTVVAAPGVHAVVLDQVTVCPGDEPDETISQGGSLDLPGIGRGQRDPELRVGGIAGAEPAAEDADQIVQTAALGRVTYT